MSPLGLGAKLNMTRVTNESHRLSFGIEARFTNFGIKYMKNIVSSSLILAKNIECLFDKYGIWNDILR